MKALGGIVTIRRRGGALAVAVLLTACGAGNAQEAVQAEQGDDAPAEAIASGGPQSVETTEAVSQVVDDNSDGSKACALLSVVEAMDFVPGSDPPYVYGDIIPSFEQATCAWGRSEVPLSKIDPNDTARLVELVKGVEVRAAVSCMPAAVEANKEGIPVTSSPSVGNSYLIAENVIATESAGCAISVGVHHAPAPTPEAELLRLLEAAVARYDGRGYG